MEARDKLEAIAQELMELFEVVSPPVPIEGMLQKPKNQMWDGVDISQLSGSFLSIKERYSPRMSLARLLVRHVASSEWGRDRNLFELLKDADNLQAFARMLIMPASMVMSMSMDARNPATMSLHFEVPEDDARVRLDEML